MKEHPYFDVDPCLHKIIFHEKFSAVTVKYSHLLIVILLPFSGKRQIDKKLSKILGHVDVAIRSQVIPILTGSTFDGFINQRNRVDLCS